MPQVPKRLKPDPAALPMEALIAEIDRIRSGIAELNQRLGVLSQSLFIYGVQSRKPPKGHNDDIPF